MREGLKELIEFDSGFEVIGCASHGIEALKLCDLLKPDLALISMDMPICDGFIGTRLIKSSQPAIKVLLINWKGDDTLHNYMFLSGADGYLFISVEIPKLRAVMKAVTAGIKFCDEEVLIP
jgi:DNA-binding NarL/FixJ family response regulator